MLAADAIIAALPELPDPDLDAVLAAVRREKEARAEKVGTAETTPSLPEVLDRLVRDLADTMDRLAGIWPWDPCTLTRGLVLDMLAATGDPYPVVAVSGFMTTVKCNCGRGVDKASGWPEILGVKAWDWPWLPVEPVKRPGREAYIRGFVLSYAPVQKAGLPVALHLSAGARPCDRCSDAYPRNYSVYLTVGVEGVREISWAAYQHACSRAAEGLEEVRLAQQKSAAGAAKAKKRG